eukprot:1092843-Pyramimonas_sp.AAC.1
MARVASLSLCLGMLLWHGAGTTAHCWEACARMGVVPTSCCESALRSAMRPRIVARVVCLCLSLGMFLWHAAGGTAQSWEACAKMGVVPVSCSESALRSRRRRGGRGAADSRKIR